MRVFQWTPELLAELRLYRVAKRPTAEIARLMGLTYRQVEHGIHLLLHPEDKEQDE